QNYRQARVMRRFANGRHVQDITVGIARGFEVQINVATGPLTLAIFRIRRPQTALKGADIVAVEKFHGDVQIARLAEPIVQQLKGAAVNVARTENDVLITEKVAQRGIDGRHAGIKVPRHVFAREGAALDIDDMIGEGDRRGIEQARIDLKERLPALKGIINPFGAGIKVSRRARDDGGGRKNGGDVVENRI